MTGKRKTFWVGGVCLLVTLEILLQTKFMEHPDPTKLAWISVCYLLIGLGVAILPLLTPSWLNQLGHNLPKWTLPLARIILLAVGSFLIFALWRAGIQIIEQHPIDFKQADMLAVIEFQCDRFIAGTPVYDRIPEIWNNMQPIYMPAFWGPFVPAKFLGIDIRWTTLLFLTVAIVLILSPQKRTDVRFLLGVIPALYYLMESIWTEQTFLIRFTEEGISLFYYVLLVIAAYRQIPWLEGLAIALCLMSRYALAPWLLIYLWWVYQNRGYRQMMWVGGTTFLLVMCGFVIPYGLEKWELFLTHSSRYQEYAERLWQKDEAFFHRTLGIVRFIGVEGLSWLYRIQIVLTFLAPLSLMLWAQKWKKSPLLSASLIQKLLPLCMLKISLVVFFNLLVVPVYYLFFINGAVSCALLTCYLQLISQPAERNEQISIKTVP